MDADDLSFIVKRMAHSSVRNYATPGLTSYLIGGGPAVGRVRLFMSDRDQREFITPHSHRFDFTCLVLRGEVRNVLYVRATENSNDLGNSFARGVLKPIDGGLGKYELLPGGSPAAYNEVPSIYTAGHTYSMRSAQIHSIYFSKDAEVLFFEGPETAEETYILEPWSNGARVPTFSTQPWMFQRERIGE